MMLVPSECNGGVVVDESIRGKRSRVLEGNMRALEEDDELDERVYVEV